MDGHLHRQGEPQGEASTAAGFRRAEPARNRRGAGTVTLELDGPATWTWWIGVEALAGRDGLLEPYPVAIAKEERLSIEARQAYFGELGTDGRSRTTLLLPPLPEGAVDAGTGAVAERWRLTANATPPHELGSVDPTPSAGFWAVVEVAAPKGD